MRWAALFVATLTCGCGIAFSTGEEADGDSEPIPTLGTGGAGASGGADGGTAMTGPGGAPTGAGGTVAEGGGGIGGDGGRAGPECATVFEEPFDDLAAWDAFTNGVNATTGLGGDGVTLYSGSVSLGLITKSSFAFTPCGVVMENTQPPTNDGLSWLYMADVVDTSYRASFVHTGSFLQARYIEPGDPQVLHEGTYDEMAHRWWRLRRTQTEVIWDVSPDGSVWARWYSHPAPSWGAGNNEISVGVTNYVGGTTASFDNISVLVPAVD